MQLWIFSKIVLPVPRVLLLPVITKLYMHPVKKKTLLEGKRWVRGGPVDTPTTGWRACGDSWTSSNHRDRTIHGPRTMETPWVLRLTVLQSQRPWAGSQHSFRRSPQLQLRLPSFPPFLSNLSPPPPQQSGLVETEHSILKANCCPAREEFGSVAH